MRSVASSKPCICLTLDGLLAHVNPHGGYHPIGDPLPGVVEFTRRLAEHAFILIYTARINVKINPDLPELEQLYNARDRVKTWLDEHSIWYDDIWMGQGKPAASLYIGPRDVAVPLNPSPDALVQVEQEIVWRLSHE